MTANIRDNLPAQSGQSSSDAVKVCTKCGKTLPATAEFFYRHPSGRFKLTPRCKPCVNVDNAASHAKRFAANPEKVRRQATERAKRSYARNLEANRARQREHQKKRRDDPVKGAEIRARKRADGAGLTSGQINDMFARQGCACAICGSRDPGAKAGWNLDHCHSTGVVRFILCAHCNRGLGAFRDNPSLMRRAADMLEALND